MPDTSSGKLPGLAVAFTTASDSSTVDMQAFGYAGLSGGPTNTACQLSFIVDGVEQGIAAMVSGLSGLAQNGSVYQYLSIVAAQRIFVSAGDHTIEMKVVPGAGCYPTLQMYVTLR